MRIYISGAITGTDDYMERFKKAEWKLTERGCSVVNPAKVNSMMPKDTTYEQYMDVSLALLETCDAIYMLNGWEESKGAVFEEHYADIKGLQIMHEKDDIQEKKYYWRLKGLW